jgi:phosphatidate cytidylyltransferase
MNTIILRSASGALYVLLFIGTVLSPYSILFQLFIGALTVLSAYELARMQSKSIPWAIVTAVVTLAAGTLILPPLLTGLLGAVLALIALLCFKSSFKIPRFMWMYSLVYMALGISSFYGVYATSQWLCFAMLVVLWTNDTLAYAVGSLIGKTKITSISPKKSLEGYIGGLIFSLIASFLLNRNLDLGLTAIQSVILGAVISITADFGDLLISKLKRLYNFKDSGRLIPGHGGIMDRIDSLIFAMPFIYLFLHVFIFNSL